MNTGCRLLAVAFTSDDDLKIFADVPSCYPAGTNLETSELRPIRDEIYVQIYASHEYPDSDILVYRVPSLQIDKEMSFMTPKWAVGSISGNEWKPENWRRFGYAELTQAQLDCAREQYLEKTGLQFYELNNRDLYEFIDSERLKHRSAEPRGFKKVLRKPVDAC